MKRYDIHKPIVFKKGMYHLNDNDNLNYQLCRVVNWNHGDLKEIEEIGPKIKTFEDWKRELISLGKKAEAEERYDNAIGYYRMADFFISYNDKDKLANYNYARKLFYDYYGDFFEGDKPIVERLEVSYKDNIKLPVLHCLPENNNKGIILLHGGNDSYMEEFFFQMLYLRENGYEVYLYEGPGQGSVIRNQECPFTYRWEETSKAITDKYNLNNVTIVGISLGGYFAPRAGAFDKRISRIAGWSVYPSTWEVFEKQMGEKKVALLKKILKYKGDSIVDSIFEKMAKKGELYAQVIKDMCHSYGVNKISELGRTIDNYDLRNCAENIKQDVLIIGADKDTMIDRTLIGRELDMLKSAHSLTYSELKTVEEAGDHCNLGNTKLALDTIIHWMNYIDTLSGE